MEVHFLNSCTLPSFTKLDGRELQDIPLSAPFLSWTKLNNDFDICTLSTFDTGVWPLLETLTILLAEATSLLFDVELKLSSELQYLPERAGETCLYQYNENGFCLDQITKVH